MTMLCKKLLSGLLAMMLLLSLAPSAFAEETLLKVILTGVANGSSVELNAVFDVYQDNQKVGALNVVPGGENTIALPGSGTVALVPVAGSYPAQAQMNVYGYGVAVMPGCLNIAPIEVQMSKTTAAVTAAPAGTKATATPVPTATATPGPTPTIAPVSDGALFILLAEVQASFELATEDGEVVLSFETDEDGNYAAEKALPEGTYVLSMTASKEELWPDMYIDLWQGEVQLIHSPFWRPSKANNANLRAAVTAVPTAGAVTAEPTAAPTAEPTVAPTADPTAEPTAAPTAEPTVAPTADPTAEPTAAPTAEPTAEPTAAPTAEPATEPSAAPTAEPVTDASAVGGLFLMAEGYDATADFTMSRDGAVYGSGKLSIASAAYVDGVPEGNYLFTLVMPENVAVVSLNGNPTFAYGKVEWKGSVWAGEDVFYSVEFGEAASVRINTGDTAPTRVTMTAPGGWIETLEGEGGVYLGSTQDLGEYTVNVTLPAGDYDMDASVWQMTNNNDGTYTASAKANMTIGKTVELPAISIKKAPVVTAAPEAAQQSAAQATQAPASNIRGSVSGFVADLNGDMMLGVTVTVCDADGNVVGQTATDSNGRWQVGDLPGGEYSVHYSDDKRAIPVETFVIGEGSQTVMLSAGAEKPAKITVHAFLDDNNNGSCGKGEADMQNAQVALVSKEGVVVASGVTDKSGLVTLSAVEGMYYVRVTAPQDYGYGKMGSGYTENQSIMNENPDRTQQSNPVTLTTGKTLKVGAGLVKMGAVTGTVWNDENGDGIWQTGEPGIPGIKVTLTGKKNGQSMETTTDANGEYAFHQAQKGTYVLKCYVPDEYVFTQKAKGKKNAPESISCMTTEADRIGEADVTVKQGEVSDGNSIGLMEGVIIEGVCFFDANNNGSFDEGELPMPGVEMRLARQSNNVLLQHVTSDENGEYRFVGQRGSTFTLRANLPKGCVFSVLGTDENGNMFKPNGDKTERRLTDITLENGAYQRINLGAIKYGSIEGRVYFDKDFSGNWTRGEAIKSGKSVTLYDENGEKVATKKSDKNGLFAFTKLMPGKYSLEVEPDKGYSFTSMGGDNVMQAQPNGMGRSLVLDLRMGEEVKNAGAGMIVPAYVSGVFFADTNDNGVYDAGEQGMEGAVVRLMGENGETNAITIGKSAEFFFSAAPGRYYLKYELPEGGLFTKVVEGGNAITGENGQGQSEWFTIATEQTWNAQPCGALMLGGISGMTYSDTNGNSVMDADESPLAGVVFTLTPNRSDLSTLTIVSDAQGQYAMNDLRPDVYTLTVTLPGNTVLTRIPNVKLGLVHGKNSQSVTLDLTFGGQFHDQDLGCVIPASWAGEAFLDENYDGVRAGDEAPAKDEKIVLMDAKTGETVSEVYTDVNGRFLIEGIAPGEYELVYPMDEGNLVPMNGSSDFYQNGDMMTNGRVSIISNEAKTGTVLCIVRTTEISGTVILQQGDGNLPIKNATVHLLDAYGNQMEEIITGADGKYAFKGLMPGDYALDATIPAGYVLVESDDSLLVEEGLKTFVEESQGQYGKSSVIDLRMAEHHKNLDVVMVLPGRLGDKVWLDLNANGLQDGNEGGIPGVTIELLRDENVLASTISDQYGYFVFEGLYPAYYTLRVTWPAEVVPTTLRTDLGQITSVLQADGMTIPVRVESNKANYAADLGFVLVQDGVFPAGYGEGEQQVWKKK